MGIEKISIEQLLLLSQDRPILDVRSPGEYAHAHIPHAYSLPLFSDEERKIIGTAYKQESRKKAIKLGLDFFGVKMRTMAEAAEKILAEDAAKKNGKLSKQQSPQQVIVHCWRGGMRSAAVAWLLDLYGFEVFLLEGGYKVYRNWVLEQFEKDYDLQVIGGYTGSGKTGLLKALELKGHSMIDLEGLANHKGSAFGAIGQPVQPTQEMFENLLAMVLYKKASSCSWLEDESQRIGVLNIPHSLWRTMRNKPVYFIDIPFEQRLDHITSEYGVLKKDLLINAILRIQKRLGPLETKTAIGFLVEDNPRECFRVLLNYYDKSYLKGLYNRENIAGLLNKIPCSGVDPIANTEKLVSCNNVNT